MKKIKPVEHELKGTGFEGILAEIAVILRDTLDNGNTIAQAAIHIGNRYRGLHANEQLCLLFKQHKLCQPTVKELSPHKLVLWIRPSAPLFLLDRIVHIGRSVGKIFLNGESSVTRSLYADVAEEVVKKTKVIQTNAIPVRIVLTVFKAGCLEEIQDYFGETDGIRLERLLEILPEDASHKLRSIGEFTIVAGTDDTTLRALDVQIHSQSVNPVPMLRLRWQLGGKNGVFATREVSAIPNQGITIGRSSKCDYILDFPEISGQHLCITPFKNGNVPSGIVISDDHSSNGTYQLHGNPLPIIALFVKIGESVTFVLGCGRVGQHDMKGQPITEDFVRECIANPDAQKCLTIEASLS